MRAWMGAWVRGCVGAWVRGCVGACVGAWVRGWVTYRAIASEKDEVQEPLKG